MSAGAAVACCPVVVAAGVDVVDGAVAMGDDALAATKEELEDEKYFGK